MILQNILVSYIYNFQVKVNHLSPLGLNLDTLCVQQLDTVPSCENYSTLYIDAKHLVKEMNWGC